MQLKNGDEDGYADIFSANNSPINLKILDSLYQSSRPYEQLDLRFYLRETGGTAQQSFTPSKFTPFSRHGSNSSYIYIYNRQYDKIISPSLAI